MRWGIIGTGKIAHDFVTALFASDEHEVVAVASRTLSRSQEFASAHNIGQAYGSYSELLKDTEVQVVYVANGSADHIATALACFAHKKPVLVEKPMALTTEGARRMVAAADVAQIFLMEGVWMHFFPVMKQIKAAIAEGEIGEVSSVQASFGWRNPTEANPGVEDASEGGGALSAVGIYLVHLALLAFGGQRPAKVEAIGELGDLGADVHTSMLLGWPGNKHAILTCSLRENFTGEATIHGSKGSVHVPFPFLCPVQAVLRVDGAEARPLRHELPVSPQVVDASGTVISGKFNLVHSAGLLYEADAVAHSVQAGELKSDTVPLERSLLAIEIMDIVREKIGLNYKDTE